MKEVESTLYIFNNGPLFLSPYFQPVRNQQQLPLFITDFPYLRIIWIFDYTQLPYHSETMNQVKHESKSYKMRNISLNFGYAYNWVFARNCAPLSPIRR